MPITEIQPLLNGADLMYAISVATINYNLKYNDDSIQTENIGTVELYTHTGDVGRTKIVLDGAGKFLDGIIAPWKASESTLKSDAEAGD